MSFLLAALPAVHQAAAALTPSPSLSPSVTPAVQAAVNAHAAAQAVPATPGLSDMLNSLAALLSPYVIVIGAVVANFVQLWLNKLPWLGHDVAKVQDLYRRLVAVALPLLGTYAASFATGHNDIGFAPWIFLVGQILFATFRALKALGANDAQTAGSLDAPAAG